MQYILLLVLLVEKTVRLRAEDTSSNHPKVKEQKTSARASDRKRGPISIISERDRAEGFSLYLSLSFVYQYIYIYIWKASPHAAVPCFLSGC